MPSIPLITRIAAAAALAGATALSARPALAFDHPAAMLEPPPPTATATLPIGPDLSDFLVRLRLTPAQEALWEKAEVAQSSLAATGPYKRRKQRDSAQAMLADARLPVGEAVRRIGQDRLDEIKRQVEADNLWLDFLASLDERQGNLVRSLLLQGIEMAENRPGLAMMTRRPPAPGAAMPPAGGEDGRPRPPR